MAWIESHQSLRQHPKVIKAARALGISKVTLIGHLHCLWWWALDYAQDGNLAAYEPADIADAAEWTGDPDAFIAALAESSRIGNKPGLLEYHNGTLTIHDWYDYAGKLIDRRREDADRKRTGRSKDVHRTSVGNPPEVHTPSFVPTNQPNSNQPNQTEPTNLMQDDAEISPEVRAINNAYDACGLMTSKTHQDIHLETIKRTGLPAWQIGFAEALKAGKHNIPKYVARCAESAMIAEQKGNGNGRTDTSRGFGLASLTTDADRAYHAANTPEAIAKLQAEWDAS